MKFKKDTTMIVSAITLILLVSFVILGLGTHVIREQKTSNFEADVMQMQKQSESTQIDDIEKDLMDTQLDNIDQEIEAIEQELDATI
jgi:uncharacterized protein HemX